MKYNKKLAISLSIVVYTFFILFSWLTGYHPGKEISYSFMTFAAEMLKILPCAFILIGLFEVWVKRETVEKHFGNGSGFKGYLWSILLAGTAVGGLYVAFPVAYSLYSKGAKLSMVFTYLGAAAVCRIPMTVFEASFMGIKFTVIRLSFSLVLVILSSILLGNYLEKKGYSINKGR